MRCFLLFLALVVLFSSPVYAGETVKINVNGMVCDFCARAIEKVFGKQEAVDNIAVNLTDKLITLAMKDGQTMDDEAITKLINDSGYALVSIQREEATDGQGQ